MERYLAIPRFCCVLTAFLAASLTVEPTVIVLCITMILTVQNFKANQGISIFTALLGVIAAFLAVAEKAEVGVLDLIFGCWWVYWLAYPRPLSIGSYSPLVSVPAQIEVAPNNRVRISQFPLALR